MDTCSKLLITRKCVYADSESRFKDPKDANQNNPIISDVLPKTRAINIFARLTRDFESVESRLSDPSKNLTVLAPRNGAIMDLPRKPWENPDDYAQFGEANAYEGEEGQDRAKRNLKRFVEAHIVTVSPWEEGDEAETLAGDKLRWTKDGDKIYVWNSPSFPYSATIITLILTYFRSNLATSKSRALRSKFRTARCGSSTAL